LKAAISRDPRDRVQEFREDRCYLAKVDVGAFKVPAFRVNERRSVAMLSGEPGLAPRNGSFSDRTADLCALQEAWDRGDWSILRAAAGLYSAAYYDLRAGQLTVLTDKLGERPLYFYAGEKHLFFANALRILEAVDAVPKRISASALAEAVAFGSPLGDRTGYAEIFRLRSGEMVTASDSGVSRRQYWLWDDIRPSTLSEEDLLRQTYDTFSAAVARLAAKDAAALAFLSGGLDSRCVVGALRSRGLTVHTLNFSPARSQDRGLANAFAQAAGTVHHEGPFGSGPALAPLTRDLLDRAWPSGAPVDRPQLIWAGDDGSISVGYVYVRAGTVEHLRERRWDAAIDSFLKDRFVHFPAKLLHPHVRSEALSAPRAGLAEELKAFRFDDPVKRLYAVLTVNHQRRHLSAVHEDTDLHRLEFLQPFFDGDFLELMMSIPSEWCLYHRFYHKWLALFPSAVASVPWQTYPEHEPCPLPIPPGLSYGWGGVRRAQVNEMKRIEAISTSREILGAGDFPNGILHKGYFRLIAALHRVRLRNYAYCIKAAEVYYRHWIRRSRLPGETPASK
jgi:hypothetical protein